MGNTNRDQTDADLQAMLRAEIVELRRQLALRESEVLALLQQSDVNAVKKLERREIAGARGGWLQSLARRTRDRLAAGGAAGWVQARAGRLRHRFALRRQVAALGNSALFDPNWYASQYPDCGGPDKAAVHYLQNGSFAGHDPSPDFSTRAYYRANPDVAAAGWPALAHYLLHGQAEGRLSHPALGG